MMPAIGTLRIPQKRVSLDGGNTLASIDGVVARSPHFDPLWHVDAVEGGGVHPIAYEAQANRCFAAGAANRRCAPDARFGTLPTSGLAPIAPVR